MLCVYPVVIYNSVLCVVVCVCVVCVCVCVVFVFFFFQAEDGIRDLVRSRGLGDVYKRQQYGFAVCTVSRIYAQ